MPMSYEKQTWAAGDTISGAKLNHIEEGVEGINMSYEKTTWQSGDTITAEKLNNIEDGIAGAGGGSLVPCTITITVEGSNSRQLGFYNFVGEDNILNGVNVVEGNYSIEDIEDTLHVGTHSFDFLLVPDQDIVFWTSADASLVTVDGAITYDSEREEYLVSGDCTIDIASTPK